MHLYAEIKKLFLNIEKFFSEEDLIKFRNTLVSDLSSYHFSLGLWIRNSYLYKKESELYHLFCANGIPHPDDMSSIIILIFHDYISRKI